LLAVETRERRTRDPGVEQLTDERCGACGCQGQVYVSAFRWNAGLHLRVHCRACRNVHVIPERRRTTPAFSAIT
jgi:hypothetical protein